MHSWQVHTVPTLPPGVAVAPPSCSPAQGQRSESRASWFHMLFLLVPPLGQELLADFHWILNFKFENKIQSAFTGPCFFKALKVILLCLCSALSLTSSDLILRTDVSPRLGEQELLFASFTGKRLALKGGALDCRPGLPTAGSSRARDCDPHCVSGLLLGTFSPSCEM